MLPQYDTILPGPLPSWAHEAAQAGAILDVSQLKGLPCQAGGLGGGRSPSCWVILGVHSGKGVHGGVQIQAKMRAEDVRGNRRTRGVGARLVQVESGVPPAQKCTQR